MDLAADYYLAQFRLANMFGRGAIIFDTLQGASGERAATYLLAQRREKLLPAQARKVIAALMRAAAEQEDAATIIARDAAYWDATRGWHQRLETAWLKLFGQKSVHATLIEGHRREQSTRSSLLMTDLGVRLFQQEHGRQPENINELVPRYLPAVPLDPFAPVPRPVRYRAETGNFAVYSVGHDGQDNGGHFANEHDYWWYWRSAGYDYDLDLPTRP